MEYLCQNWNLCAAAAPHSVTTASAHVLAPAHGDDKPAVTTNGSAKNHRAKTNHPPLLQPDQEYYFNYNPDFGSSENMPGGELKGSGSLPGRYSSSTPTPRRSSPEKEPSKKWTFGGLFRRKEKGPEKEKTKNPLQSSASVPITIQFEPTQRPSSSNSKSIATISCPPVAASESDTESSVEVTAVVVPKQNFLSRKLSRRSKKSGRVKKSATRTRVGIDSQYLTIDTLNGKSDRPPLQSWETTKKPALLMPPNVNNHGMANYSSSGSLSLSVDGSSLSRESRAAAREATKARAAARRESYLEDTSSSSGEEGGSFQGSHSSLSSRTRKQQVATRRKQTTNGGGGIPLNSSPNLNRVGGNGNIPPSSPRWEARVVYTKETFGENDDPVIFKLPKTEMNGGPYILQQTMISGDQQVITAGLKVPFLMSPTNNNVVEPIYANLPLMGLTSESSPPLPPPRKEFQGQIGQTTPNFFRPMSCSYLDSYNNSGNLNQRVAQNNNEMHNRNSHHFLNGQEPQSLLEYEAEPKRLVPSSPILRKNFPQSQSPKIPEINLHRDSPKLNWHEQHDFSLSMNPNGESHEPRPASSKLGFPVRKLHDNGDLKLPKTQSPVHVRASAFWRQKEQENGITPKQQPATSPSPNFLTQYQKQHLTRIRSADSSPQSVPKFLSGKKPSHRRMINSNESISSLSSFSVEAPSASPNMFSNKYSNKIQAGPLKPRNLKSPDFKITVPNGQNNNKENVPKSACERLQVRFGSPSPVSVSPTKAITKTPRKNLEEALNELEDMYKSLRLSDEDLLDRAERRDLPTAHQELRDKEPIQVSRIFRFTPPGSLESLATTSGSGGSSENARYPRPRQRAPPMRRSCLPDLVNDDMAKRKFDSKDSKPNDPREVVSQGGSYLVLSPAFSPSTSPCPPDNYPFILSLHDPDLTMDDVTVRNYKRANAIKIIEPQPLFGIPLGPVTPAPASDYLHSKPIEKYRPLFRHVKNPDIVKDDIAFRNLRKDLNQENNLSKDWTPRLFSPLRQSVDSEVFNYNIPYDENRNNQTKKLRAIRSLSANISNLVPTTTSPVNNEIGKWNSYSELHSRSSRSMTPVNFRASTYMEPSWVQQADLDYDLQFSKEAWDRQSQSPTFSYIKNKEVRHQSENLDHYSKSQSQLRRPWTDIILESFEKEKQKELEEQDAEAVGEIFIENDEDEVFVDASEVTPRESPRNVKNRDLSTPQAEFQGFPITSLLNGQTHRRGSWVEQSLKNSNSDIDGNDSKRKSWSDVPKQYQLARNTSPSGPNFLSQANPGNSHFTPLPPPRRVKQISLEGFAPNHLGEETISLPTTSTSDINYPSPIAAPRSHIDVQSPSRGELELNDLIDALVREADTCGPPVVMAMASDEFHSLPLQKSQEFVEQDGEHPVEDSISNLISYTNYLIRKSLPDLKASCDAQELEEEDYFQPPKTKDEVEIEEDKLAATIVAPSPKDSSSWEKKYEDNLLTELKHDYDKLEDIDEPDSTISTSMLSRRETENSRKKSIDNESNNTINFGSAPGPGVSDLPGEEKSMTKKLQGGGRKKQTKANEFQVPGSRFEKSIGKIGYQTNSAFEVRNGRHVNMGKEEISASFPGITKVSFPVWRISQSKTQPITAGFKESETKGNEKVDLQIPLSAIENHTHSHSRSLQPWKANAGENRNSVLLNSSDISKNVQPSSFTEKLSSSSSESEKKELPRNQNQYEQLAVHKRDSLSDAEGMSGLKRLLRKETTTATATGQNYYPFNASNNTLTPNFNTSSQVNTFGGIKKSPSAGSTSYWSRISSGQPSFIRRFFEKSSPSLKTKPQAQAQPSNDLIPGRHEEQEQIQESNSVIKRNGSGDDSKINAEAPKIELLEPVLSLNVAQKASMFMKMEHDQRFSKWHNSAQNDKMSIEGRPRSSRFSTQLVTPGEVISAASKTYEDFKPTNENLNLTVQIQTSLPMTIQHSNQSSSADVDDKVSTGSELLEPSRLSLKDRVNMFNRMSTVPMIIVQSRPPSTSRPCGSNLKLNNFPGLDYMNTGGLISKSLNNDTDSSYDNLTGFPSDYKRDINLRRRRGSDSNVTMSGTNFFKGHQNQNQEHDLPLACAYVTDSKIPIAMLRNKRVKSMFVTHSSDPDNLSEDGEISSGGQEVAEIISKSFENSPIFRKKSWKTQQSQPSFAKELWRKFGKDHPGQGSVTPQFGFQHQNINPITSPMFPKLMRAQAPATSNLLPILSALSSSDDQLSEANKPSSVPPIKPKRSNIRKILNQKIETDIPMCPPPQPQPQPQPVDKSFAQCNSGNGNDTKTDSLTVNAHLNPTSSEDISFSSVKREGDLLIMKKHMPILRRKSSGKSRNPLKVLAARMDFRNQKYTETLLDSDPDHQNQNAALVAAESAS